MSKSISVMFSNVIKSKNNQYNIQYVVINSDFN